MRTDRTFRMATSQISRTAVNTLGFHDYLQRVRHVPSSQPNGRTHVLAINASSISNVEIDANDVQTRKLLTKQVCTTMQD